MKHSELFSLCLTSQIGKDKIAILLCEKMTGHVLHFTSAKPFEDGDSSPFQIEETIDGARRTAKAMTGEDSKFEVLLYDSEGKFIEIIE